MMGPVKNLPGTTYTKGGPSTSPFSSNLQYHPDLQLNLRKLCTLVDPTFQWQRLQMDSLRKSAKFINLSLTKVWIQSWKRLN